MWEIFEVIASSAVMLCVPLERARRRDTELLLYGSPGSDEAFFPELQEDNSRWRAKRFWSVRLSWKAALLKRSAGCCYNETVPIRCEYIPQLVKFLILYTV